MSATRLEISKFQAPKNQESSLVSSWAVFKKGTPPLGPKKKSYTGKKNAFLCILIYHMLSFEQHQYSATTLGSDNTTSITSPQISKTSKNYIAIAETKFMTRPNQFLKNKYVVETTMLKNNYILQRHNSGQMLKSANFDIFDDFTASHVISIVSVL